MLRAHALLWPAQYPGALAPAAGWWKKLQRLLLEPRREERCAKNHGHWQELSDTHARIFRYSWRGRRCQKLCLRLLNSGSTDDEVFAVQKGTLVPALKRPLALSGTPLVFSALEYSEPHNLAGSSSSCSLLHQLGLHGQQCCCLIHCTVQCPPTLEV